VMQMWTNGTSVFLQRLVLGAALLGAPLLASAASDGRPMGDADVRRSGHAAVAGPQRGEIVWTHRAEDALAIRTQPTLTGNGVFFGTFGMIRQHGKPPADWDRYDGWIEGVDLRTGAALWNPIRLPRTAYAYAYAGRPPTERDRRAGPGMHLSSYSGTVDGGAALDPETGALYFGRGDGHLYAVDPRAGAVLWSFQTLDPARPEDPEGGGQIAASPLVTPSGLIVFGTYGEPAEPEIPGLVRHQTHALYAVDRKGALRWRQPAEGSLPNPFAASPALSRSGSRIYAITQRMDRSEPAQLFALDATTGAPAWTLRLDDRGGQDLAVGVDGRIYVAGVVEGAYGPKAGAFAVVDHGERGEIVWTRSFLAQRPLAHWAGGVALAEEGDSVRRVYISTTTARIAQTRAGRLHQLDPATGEVLASFDPTAADPPSAGGLTDIAIGAGETLYVGARGDSGGLLRRGVAGRMYALRADPPWFRVLWSVPVTGALDGASPTIGPDGGLYFGASASLRDFDPLEPRPAGENVPGGDAIFYAVRDAPTP